MPEEERMVFRVGDARIWMRERYWAWPERLEKGAREASTERNEDRPTKA